MNEPYSERPMNEQEWEQAMRESDIRAARFGELLETLRDHPDCDQIIAREMGWDHLLNVEREASDRDVRDEKFVPPEVEGEDAYTDEEWEEAIRKHDEELHAIGAYSRGYEWGLAVHDALKPWLEREYEPDEEPEPDDPLIVAYGDSMVVSAKIAGGHGVGYDEHALCGNIVCCKRALAAGRRSVAALEHLAQERVVSVEILEPLIDEGREVVALVEARIDELRKGVWWE